MSRRERSTGFELVDPVPTSQAEYERTIHGWDVSRTAEARDHLPGSEPEECPGCKLVEESVAFNRLQAERCPVEEPVMKIRWQGKVVGFIEKVRREVGSARSHKLKGQWHPLPSEATDAFLKRLGESEIRADDCGHLEIDCPDQYERVWFSRCPVTGEAWLTCRVRPASVAPNT